MRLFISTDMEGITSIVSEREVTAGEREYERARLLMTQEVNGAIEGAFAAGVEEVFVADAHASMMNIIPQELDERATLIRGYPRPQGMMEGLDASFSAAFFIGYHARRGTEKGVLEHTYKGTLYSLKINGKTMGELGLNAYLAGHYQVPVILVTGDDKVVQEGQELLGDIELVEVKKGLGRYATASLHPMVTKEKIARKAKRAMERIHELTPLLCSSPVQLELTFNHSGMADHAALMPGVIRKGGCTISYEAKDYLLAYQAFRVLITLASS